MLQYYKTKPNHIIVSHRNAWPEQRNHLHINIQVDRISLNRWTKSKHLGAFFDKTLVINYYNAYTKTKKLKWNQTTWLVDERNTVYNIPTTNGLTFSFVWAQKLNSQNETQILQR